MNRLSRKEIVMEELLENEMFCLLVLVSVVVLAWIFG
jgi:hypothetical protein